MDNKVMRVFKISKGLDVPIEGSPHQKITDKKQTTTYALVGPNYQGLKIKLHVKVDDDVKKGQVLFVDKKDENIKFTAPVAGKVIAINRGEKRAFQSLVIQKTDDEYVEFEKYNETQLSTLSEDKVKKYLSDSGLWVAFRTRPFDKIPLLSSSPNSIFINAMNTNPLAEDAELVIQNFQKDFLNGIKIISKLSKKIFLCKKHQSSIKIDTISNEGLSNVEEVEFCGPHPSGLSGTHIHFLDPVSSKKTVWYINYQDVIAIGKTFTQGQLYSKRIVALGGPIVKNPRLIITDIGANITELFKDELIDNNIKVRLISGSPICGYHAYGPFDYLGRYDTQVCAISDEVKREFLGWISPGLNKFSIKNVVISRFFKNKKFAFNTALNGSRRAIVPIGAYEKVMPLDIYPTFLFKALCTKNIEEAERLGCLELGEEDLALCTFVCPGKNDWGQKLREILNLIEKEG